MQNEAVHRAANLGDEMLSAISYRIIEASRSRDRNIIARFSTKMIPEEASLSSHPVDGLQGRHLGHAAPRSQGHHCAEAVYGNEGDYS